MHFIVRAVPRGMVDQNDKVWVIQLYNPVARQLPTHQRSTETREESLHGVQAAKIKSTCTIVSFLLLRLKSLV
jgi:P2-related tail formation protein